MPSSTRASMPPQALRTTRSVLMEDGRDVALELRRLVHGDLRGMFDGPTTPGLRLDGPLVVLDLAAVYHSPALGVLMACAAAWLQSAVRSQHRNRTIVVVDEAWAILSNLGVARWLQASWKLSRALGVANMAVLHRLSDLRSVGTEGSEQVNLAEGLLADSETRVVYAQSPGEAARSGELLGPHRDRGRARHPAETGHGPVEGGSSIVPGRAPTLVQRAVADRHRSSHGRLRDRRPSDGSDGGRSTSDGSRPTVGPPIRTRRPRDGPTRWNRHRHRASTGRPDGRRVADAQAGVIG